MLADVVDHMIAVEELYGAHIAGSAADADSFLLKTEVPLATAACPPSQNDASTKLGAQPRVLQGRGAMRVHEDSAMSELLCGIAEYTCAVHSACSSVEDAAKLGFAPHVSAGPRGR